MSTDRHLSDEVARRLIVDEWDGETLHCHSCFAVMVRGVQLYQWEDDDGSAQQCERPKWECPCGFSIAQDGFPWTAGETLTFIAPRLYPHAILWMPWLFDEFRQWKLIELAAFQNFEVVAGTKSRAERDAAVAEAEVTLSAWSVKLTAHEWRWYRLVKLTGQAIGADWQVFWHKTVAKPRADAEPDAA